MRENIPPNRGSGIINVAKDKTWKVDLNPELKELYGQLVEATLAMHDAARTDREKPSPSTGQKLWDVDLQIDAIIRRINQILG
jgi:hypothetical protein